MLRKSDGRLWYLEFSALLIELEGKMGEATAVARLRQEACSTAMQILEHMPNGELRSAFMAFPQVKSVLG